MLGTNSHSLNHATVCQALEEYLNKRLVGSHQVQVTKVEEDKGGGTFRVVTASKTIGDQGSQS